MKYLLHFIFFLLPFSAISMEYTNQDLTEAIKEKNHELINIILNNNIIPKKSDIFLAISKIINTDTLKRLLEARNNRPKCQIQ